MSIDGRDWIIPMSHPEAFGTLKDDWRPVFIDIETTFTDFVRTFRGGSTVGEAVGEIPRGVLNADFVFPSDGVIAELKCLEKDAGDAAEIDRRFEASARHFGHSQAEIDSFRLGLEPTPARVRARLLGMMTRPVKEVCRKAIKQIRSTKHLLRMPDARGVVLIANDNNYGLNPHAMLMTISGCINDFGRDSVNAAVYFTPNVYHDDGSNDQVAKTLWVPTYNTIDDELPPEGLQEFINDLGRSWLDLQDTFGDPAVMRWEGEEMGHIAYSVPVPALGRAQAATDAESTTSDRSDPNSQSSR